MYGSEGQDLDTLGNIDIWIHLNTSRHITIWAPVSLMTMSLL